MKKSTDEIRRVGQFVFWRDENKYSNYVSRYNQKLNQGRNLVESQTS